MSCDCNTLIVGEAGPQGPQGLAGTNGTNGTNGVNAFTTLSASFVQPSVSSTVTITVGTNQWMAVGQAIYISQAGFYTVSSFSGTTQVVVTLAKTDGISPTGNVSAGRKISPSAIATYAAPLSSLTVNGSSDLDGAVTINESGGDMDVRIEGDTDTNLFRTDASTDRVGVGIAVPEAKLHVSGAFKVGVGGSGSDAVFTRGAIFNENSSSLGDFEVRSVSLSSAFFVDASANSVGIGTNSPSKLLDVAGAMEANSILVNPGSLAGVDVFKVLGSGTAVPFIVNASSNYVGVNTLSPTAEFEVTGAAKISGNFSVDNNVLFVDTSNNYVGINTSSPAFPLSVSGSANVTGNATVGGTFGVTGSTTLASISVSGVASVSGSFTVDSGTLFVDATNNRVGINDTTPSVALDVTGSAIISNSLNVDSGTFFVDATTSKVGINNTAPSVALDVIGSAIISNTLSVSGGNFSVNTSSIFVNSTNSRVGIRNVSPSVALDVSGAVRVGGSFAVATNAGTNILYVDNSNSTVGINQNSPSAPLHVVGSAIISNNLNSQSLTVDQSLTVNTSSLFVDSTNSRVGINKTSPTVALDVVGNVDIGGTLELNGPLQRNSPVTKTTNFTVGSTENWIIVANPSAATIVTLPAPASWPGREIMIKTTEAQAVNSGSSNVVPLIGGAASTPILLATDGKWAILVSDGTSWIIMAGN